MKAAFSRTPGMRLSSHNRFAGAGKIVAGDKLAFLYKNAGKQGRRHLHRPVKPFSGGAILGDRIRLATLGLDKNVVYPLNGYAWNLGGLARATVDAVSILTRRVR